MPDSNILSTLKKFFIDEAIFNGGKEGGKGKLDWRINVDLLYCEKEKRKQNNDNKDSFK